MADQSIIAANRFGLGVRVDQQPERGDPRGWLLQQLQSFRPQVANIPTRAAVVQELADFYDRPGMGGGGGGLGRRRGARLQGAAMVDAEIPDDPRKQQRKDERKAVRRAGQSSYDDLVQARLSQALTSDDPFAERLVHFWANHFAVSADKLTTIGLSGLLEFEAIRPNLNRRFGDMLLAVEQHPAMLLYLDQAMSIGPDSAIGQRGADRGKARGLNENLAREIMELHTLGVRTGYSQADVTEFARALTGWTVGGLARGPMRRAVDGGDGDFVFTYTMHEPGSRTIMGRRYGDGGEGQARAVLADLAVHPATARHVATKLARHFAGDDPPAPMVARLEQAFLRSGGDLPTVYRALVDSPEAWAPAPMKFKTPWEWTVSAGRGVGIDGLPAKAAVNILNQLGQPVWKPGSPAGYDDLAASWAAPDALYRRVEAAQRIAAQSPAGLDARALAPRLLGDGLSNATSTAVARAESPRTALALLFVSPDFLRR